MLICFSSSSEFLSVHVHVKDLEIQKVKAPTKQKLLSPTENTASETPHL